MGGKRQESMTTLWSRSPKPKGDKASIHCSWCGEEIELSQVSNCPHCSGARN